MMKKQNGITLIALVITIIVLLILAGVSIAMLTGDNGILTKASSSKTSTNQAEVLERVNMELNAQMANAMAGDDFDKVDNMIKSLGGKSGETTVKIAGYTVTPTLTAASGEEKASVSIAITEGDSATAFSPATGTVSYDKTENMWKIVPVKAKEQTTTPSGE